MKLTPIAFACALSLCGVGYADTTSNISTTVQQAQLQQELNQLQQQIAQLNTQISAKMTAQTQQSSGLVTSNSSLGQLSHVFSRGDFPVETDSAAYFEEMPSTTFSLAVLQSKPDYALGSLAMGGYLESDLQASQGQSIPVQSNNNGGLQTSPSRATDFNVTTLNADLMANINSWSQAFVSYKAANLAQSTATDTVNKAFVTVGNLQQTPFYVTLGQTYIPFGAFGGNGPWSVELSRAYFRSNEIPQAIFGYYQNGLDTSFSVFNDPIKGQIADFAYNLDYTQHVNTDWTWDMGVSYMNDVRGIQSTLGQAFLANSALVPNSSSATSLQTGQGINPAVDVNAEVDYQIFSVIAEYDQTLRSNYISNYSALTPGTNIGQTRAWYVSGSATPTLNKPTTFMVTYSGASGVTGIPTGLANDLTAGLTATTGQKQAWILSASQPVWKQLYLGLEYQRATMTTNQGVNAYTLDSSLYF